MLNKPTSFTRSVAVHVLVASLFVSLSAGQASAASPSLDQLTFMTGHWSGTQGDTTLEEAWFAPKSGVMSALARFYNRERTTFTELIMIEPGEDTLVLRLQQWRGGFTPVTEQPQKMKLDRLSANSATFVADGPGGLQSLTYTRTDESTFRINVLLAEGNTFVWEMRAVGQN